MKINFGCGKRVLDGFYNIDAVRNEGAPRDPELIFQLEFDDIGCLSNKLPIDSGSADYVQAMHVIEHFYHWEAINVLYEFKRLLKEGGTLVLELPDIMKAAHNLINGLGDQMSMWPLYGDWGHRDPFMMHKHGYTPETIAALLKDCGFKKVKVLPPQTHGRRSNRDMRVECIK